MSDSELPSPSGARRSLQLHPITGEPPSKRKAAARSLRPLASGGGSRGTSLLRKRGVTTDGKLLLRERSEPAAEPELDGGESYDNGRSEDDTRTPATRKQTRAKAAKMKCRAVGKAKAKRAAGVQRAEKAAVSPERSINSRMAPLPAVIKAAAARQRALEDERNEIPPEMQRVIDDAIVLGNRKAAATIRALGLGEDSMGCAFVDSTRNPVPRTVIAGACVPARKEEELAASSGGKAVGTTATPGVVPTKAWIAECLETFNELRACHGTPQPLEWSKQCFAKAKKMAKEYATTGNVTREPGAYVKESYAFLTGQFALGGQAGQMGGNEAWSAVHAIRLAFATGTALGFFKASYAGVALSGCGTVICFDYDGPWLGGGPRGFLNSNGPITGNHPGCDRNSKKAIAKLEAKLNATGTTFYDVGCAQCRMQMKAVWDILVSKKGHY